MFHPKCQCILPFILVWGTNKWLLWFCLYLILTGYKTILATDFCLHGIWMVLLKNICFPAHVTKSSLDITLYKKFSWIFPTAIILLVWNANLYYSTYWGLADNSVCSLTGLEENTYDEGLAWVEQSACPMLSRYLLNMSYFLNFGGTQCLIYLCRFPWPSSVMHMLRKHLLKWIV